MKKRLSRLIFISLFLLRFWNLRSQTEDVGEKYFFHPPADSIRTLPSKQGKAAVETAGINIGIWAFNWFVIQEDFAKIKFKTMRK
ncbi:MAG: hypothetical protein LBC47_10270 [Tannerella sp.]|jgi:hypothetical protein|nr:hypothetical protein [Tannerella sp.]